MVNESEGNKKEWGYQLSKIQPHFYSLLIILMFSHMICLLKKIMQSWHHRNLVKAPWKMSRRKWRRLKQYTQLHFMLGKKENKFRRQLKEILFKNVYTKGFLSNGKKHHYNYKL